MAVDVLKIYPEAPAYFQRAYSFIGTKELHRGKLNPIIEAWLVNHTHFPPDLINNKTAWCGAFVDAMLEQSGYESPHSASAEAHLKLGTKATDPLYKVAVLRRGTSQFHVGFYAGMAADKIMILCGNQSDAVCIKLYPAIALLDVRAPHLA